MFLRLFLSSETSCGGFTEKRMVGGERKVMSWTDIVNLMELFLFSAPFRGVCEAFIQSRILA